MVTIRAHDSDGKGRTRRRLSKVASLALGIAMFGTVGLSGTLAQDDGVTVGADTETMVDNIIRRSSRKSLVAVSSLRLSPVAATSTSAATWAAV